jgi:hypothetical protein
MPMKFAIVGKFTQADFPEAINCCPTRSKVVLMSIVSGNTYLQTHRIGLSVLRLTVVVFSTFSCCVVLLPLGLLHIIKSLSTWRNLFIRKFQVEDNPPSLLHSLTGPQ